jgi:hypothetical protein
MKIEKRNNKFIKKTPTTTRSGPRVTLGLPWGSHGSPGQGARKQPTAPVPPWQGLAARLGLWPGTGPNPTRRG